MTWRMTFVNITVNKENYSNQNEENRELNFLKRFITSNSFWKLAIICMGISAKIQRKIINFISFTRKVQYKLQNII